MRALYLLLLLTSFAARAGGSSSPKTTPVQDVVANYVRMVDASYRDSLELARQLKADVDAFVAQPTAASLTKARDSWTRARKVYGQTEVYRFYEGPIDDADGPEGLLNAWPVDESYLDSVIRKPKLHPRLSKELLVELNERDGETNIATGFHAVEFLLWGKDLSKTGPGQRPHTDYVVGKNPHAARRGEYLKLATELIVDHLAAVHAEWADGKGAYARNFLAGDGRESLHKILQAVATLAGFELSGERMLAAVGSGSQEDEHSCFSDTTHLDLWANGQGIANVFYGRYESERHPVKGPGLETLYAAQDPKAAEKLKAELEDALRALDQIRKPFDQALASTQGKAEIKAAAAKLDIFAKSLVEASKKFGLEVRIAN